MDRSVIQLKELIELLQLYGVSRFKGHGVELDFGPVAGGESNPELLGSFLAPSDYHNENASIYDNPDLWPGGQKPTFGKGDE